MPDRDLIIVDTETTGLNPGRHHIVEVSAINTRTGDELHFVPHLPSSARETMDFDALRINRYLERRLDEQALNFEDTGTRYAELWNMLDGNTLAGSNPSFDASMLVVAFGAHVEAGTDAPWHHRMIDLGTYAAGVLGLELTSSLGLGAVCERLGVTNWAEHTVLGDARATVECFAKLQAVAVTNWAEHTAPGEVTECGGFA